MFFTEKEREEQREREKEKGKKKDEQRVWNLVDWNWWQNPLCVGRTSPSFHPILLTLLWIIPTIEENGSEFEFCMKNKELRGRGVT